MRCSAVDEKFLRLANDARAVYTSVVGERPPPSPGPSVPKMFTYDGFDNSHELLTVVNIGSCLEPKIPDSAVCFFDPKLPPREHHIHALFEPADNTYIIKGLRRGPGGRWLLCSNQTPRWLRGQQVIGPLVLSVHYEGWPLLSPAETARIDAASAEYERQCQAKRAQMHARQRAV